MKVRGYRVFYIDHESGIKDLIEIIKNTTATKLAFVIKNSQLILNSSVNLKLLKKSVKRYKKELVFVSPDSLVVEKVARQGFLLYKNLNGLEMNISKKPDNYGKKIGKNINERINAETLKRNKDNEDFILLNNNNIEVKKSISVSREDDDEHTKNYDKGYTTDKKYSKMKNEDTENYGYKKNNNDKRRSHKRRFTGFFSLTLILLIIAMAYFFFLYPTATIEVEPVTKTARHQIAVAASIGAKQIDWDNNILPLHETEVEISGQEEIATTGVRLVGDTTARGIVKFINERKDDLKIPVGTIIMTEKNTKFKTTRDLIVPKLEVDYLMDVPVGMKAGQAEVEIEALVAGSKGNVGIGRIKKLENPMDNVYVINPEPSMGGEDKRVPLVAEEDIERAKNALNEKLKSELITKIYQELGGNYRIIEDKITYSEPSYKFNHSVGDTTDTIIVEGSLTAKGYLLRNNEIDRLVTVLFKDELPSNVQLMSSGINIESIELEEKGNSMYNILIGINAPVISAIDSENLVKQLSGLNLMEAQSLLEENGDIDNFTINSQNTRLPNMGFAIKVVVKEPESIKVFNLNE